MTNPPFRVDPAVEMAVRERLRKYKLALMQARERGEQFPSDNLGFVSPYRAQAMARIAQNTLGPDSPWYPQFTMRESPDSVPADRPALTVSPEFRKSYAEREDTDRARVNAYSLMRALQAQQDAKEAEKKKARVPYRY